MAQGEDLHGKLPTRSEEGEAGEEQGAEEVEHGPGRLPGSALTSMI